MILHYRIDGSIRTVTLERSTEGYRVLLDGRTVGVIVRRAQEGRLEILIDGSPCAGFAVRDGDRRIVQVDRSGPVTLVRTFPGRDKERPVPAGDDQVAAVMDGQIVAVSVREGEPVGAGATLVVLEAMKMEIRVVAPHAGIVRRLYCKAGDVVERGRTLVEIGPAVPAGPERAG
jgi:3-methylcrotonyl-CoA carboxylase alpha subunit